MTISKYHPLRYDEEQQLREMEGKLMRLEKVLFFYRTKCNGFRVGFEAQAAITTNEQYESLCLAAEESVRQITPDKSYSDNLGGAWFHVDRVTAGGRAMRSNAYWSYPRIQNPVWLNPNRVIE